MLQAELLQEEFSITTTRLDGCLVVIVRGELDELNASSLDQTLTALPPGTPVIVDLSEVSFICSGSLHVLLRDRPQGRPVLVAPPGNVRNVLAIVNTHRTTPIFDDRYTALQSLTLSQLRQTG